MTDSSAEKSARTARIVLAVLVAICFAPIFRHPFALLGDDPAKTHDYLQQATYDYLFRHAIVDDHQFPLRTHMLGGGYPLPANPQDATFSPFSLVTLVAGEALGMKIDILLFTMIGAIGFFSLAWRGFKSTILGAFFGAAAYALSGWWLTRLEWGFYFKLYFHFVPWIWLGLEKARRGEGTIVMPGLLLAVVLTQLGLGYAVIGLFFFAYFLLDMIASRSSAKSVSRMAGIVIGAFALSLVFAAAKVIPMAQLLAASPRGVTDYRTYLGAYGGYPHFWKSIPVFLRSLVFYSGIPNEPVAPGIVTLLLSAIGLAVCARKHWPLLLVTAWFALICFGPYLPVDFFRPLWRLPVFHSMHAPYQLFSYFVLLAICLFAAKGFDVFGAALKSPRGHWAALTFTVCLIALFAQALSRDLPLLSRIFVSPVPAQEWNAAFYQVRGEDMARGAPRSPLTQEYFNVRRNVGTIDWDGDVLLPEKAQPKYLIDLRDEKHENPDYRGEVYFASGQGRVDFWRITPNHIEINGTAESAAVLAVNQNYDENFRGFPEVIDDNGLLAAKVPPGPFRVQFVYRPLPIYAGMTISILSLIAAYVWSVGQRGRIPQGRHEIRG